MAYFRALTGGSSGGSVPQGALNMIPYDNSWTCTDDGHYSNDYTFEASLKTPNILGSGSRGWLPNSSSQKYGLVNFGQLKHIEFITYGRGANGTQSAFTDYIDKIQYSTDGTNFVDLPNSETTLSSSATVSTMITSFYAGIDAMAIKFLVRAESSSGLGIKIAFWN